MIHPSSWRSPTENHLSRGRFVKAKELLTSNTLLYLNMNDREAGQKIFGVTSNFDYYVCQKTGIESKEVLVNDSKDNNTLVDIEGKSFIPSGEFDRIYNLVAKNNEQKIEILHDSAYHTILEWVSKEKSDKFCYPVVNSITKTKGLTFYWSSVNNRGHYRVPKVMLAKINGGKADDKAWIDLTGEYAISQYMFAIIDKPENFENIKKALENPDFIELMDYAPKSNNNSCDMKILATFRKDFWKDFI